MPGPTAARPQAVNETAFGSLFTPLRMGSLTLKNRVALAPMTVAYGHPDGSVSRTEIEYYARRAHGGAGLVITEHFTVSEAGRQLPRQTVVDDAAKLPGLRALAQAVHEAGSPIVAQIGHAGRYGGPWDEYERRPRLAPSAIPFPLLGRVVTPREMTLQDIRDTVRDVGRAAGLLVAAGFDGVQLHASQGFLPSQFLSPRTNVRTDDYGGGFENRIRFVTECVDEIRRHTGPDFLIGIQLLADEFVHGGWTLHEATELAIVLEQRGLDFILPSVTTFETIRQATEHGEGRRWGHQLGAAIALRAAVGIPVLANGGITDPAVADRLIAAGLVDGVALARPLLADPDWPVKARRGELDAIRRCACDPPKCLRTQLDGVVCASWPRQVPDGDCQPAGGAAC